MHLTIPWYLKWITTNKFITLIIKHFKSIAINLVINNYSLCLHLYGCSVIFLWVVGVNKSPLDKA